jgi:hypothetical protein
MRKLLAVLVSVVLGACTGLSALEPGLFKAEPDPKGEISILPVGRPSPAPGTESPLRVRFDVKNATSRLLPLPVIEARVLGADGSLRGFFGIQLTVPLAAGESSRYLIRSDAVTVRYDDTIVLVPVRDADAAPVNALR